MSTAGHSRSLPWASNRPGMRTWSRGRVPNGARPRNTGACNVLRLGALPAVDLHLFDPVRLCCARALRVDTGEFVQHLQALADLTEDRVTTVEPGRGTEGDEELRAVRSRAGVGHGQDALGVVLKVRMKLVREAVPGAARSGARGVTALRHEVLEDAVEGHSVVVAVQREEHEVVHRVRGVLGVEIDYDVALAGPDVCLVVASGLQDIFRGRELRAPLRLPLNCFECHLIPP